MSKIVEFSKHKEPEYFVAAFYNTEGEVHRKALTDVETEGLSGVINFNSLPAVVDAVELLDKTDELTFATYGGEPTNFELLLIDLIYKR